MTETAATSTAETYWHKTRRPLPCLVFLIPLLTLYEVGVLWASQHGGNLNLVQNGADSWMRWAIGRLGFSPAYVLPFVILLVFTGWQVWTREPWKMDGEVMLGMLGESLVLAVGLMVIGRVQDIAFHRIEASQVVASIGDSATTLDRLVSYVGAGIYEETMFRLILLPAVYYCLIALGIPSPVSMTLSMTASALAFAAAHHIGPLSEPFVWFNFIFRWVAGLFFASVFALRGFGIAVGAHAAYDILVGVLQFQL
jgi:Type II CAAX prenyl endopeptidase Rce1-like